MNNRAVRPAAGVQAEYFVKKAYLADKAEYVKDANTNEESPSCSIHRKAVELS